jgi:hypothetical protein
MTHAVINLHRQPSDPDPGSEMHGSINLYGDRRSEIRMNVGGYRTSWSVGLTHHAAVELARALTDENTVAIADFGMGRIIVDKGFGPGLAILTIKTEEVTMGTQMTQADAVHLARALIEIWSDWIK